MAYDRLKDNIDNINYALLKNGISAPSTVGEGESATSVVMLAEDLSNFVDVGTALADLDIDKLKTFAKDLMMGIARTEWLTREYKAETHGIVKSGDEYNGALQRVSMKNLGTVMESHIRNLVDGQNYIDGKFYGHGELDVKIFNDEFDFKVPYSVGYDDLKARFVNIDEADTMLAQIIVRVRNTIEVAMKKIADTVLNKAIVDSVDDNRVVHLITSFNSYYGYTGQNAKTKADILASRELRNEFGIFVELAFSLVRDGMKKMNTKYNGAEVTTFTPTDKIHLIGLTEFKNLMGGISYETNAILPMMETTLSWQSDGQGILPSFADCSMIKHGTISISDGVITEGADVESIDDVVAFMYDTDGLGVSKVINKVTVEEVGAEGFRTYFTHVGLKQYCDERLNAVAFMLD